MCMKKHWWGALPLLSAVGKRGAFSTVLEYRWHQSQGEPRIVCCHISCLLPWLCSSPWLKTGCGWRKPHSHSYLATFLSLVCQAESAWT